MPRETSEGHERTRPCASGEGGAWRPRHACVAGTRRTTEARRDAVRYLMDGMDAMDDMDRMDRATARVAPTGFRKTPEGLGRTRSCASAQVIAPRRIPLGHWAFRVGYWIFPEGLERTRPCASGKVAYCLTQRHGETQRRGFVFLHSSVTLCVSVPLCEMRAVPQGRGTRAHPLGCLGRHGEDAVRYLLRAVVSGEQCGAEGACVLGEVGDEQGAG